MTEQDLIFENGRRRKNQQMTQVQVQPGHELSALCAQLMSRLHTTAVSTSRLTPTCNFIQPVLLTKHVEIKLIVNKHLYLHHLLVLSSPTLMMHGHMNLNLENGFIKENIHIFYTVSVKVYKKVVSQNFSSQYSCWGFVYLAAVINSICFHIENF